MHDAPTVVSFETDRLLQKHKTNYFDMFFRVIRKGLKTKNNTVHGSFRLLEVSVNCTKWSEESMGLDIQKPYESLVLATHIYHYS